MEKKSRVVMSALQMPAAAVLLLARCRLDSWCFTTVTLTESLLSEQVRQNFTSYQICSQMSYFFMKTVHLSYNLYLLNKFTKKYIFFIFPQSNPKGVTGKNIKLFSVKKVNCSHSNIIHITLTWQKVRLSEQPLNN